MKLSDLKIATRLYLGYGILMGLTAIVVAIAYANFSALVEADETGMRSHQTLAEVDAALLALVDIETGQRGFSLTGMEAALQPYTAGKQSFQQHLGQALLLTAGDAAQQERLQRLAQQQRDWLAQAIDPAIALRRGVLDADLSAVAAGEQAGKGTAGMDAMRALAGQLKRAEAEQLARHAQDIAALQSAMRRTLVGGGLVAGVLALFMAYQLGRNISIPLDRAVRLARGVAQGDLSLEVKVRTRDEAGALMAALKDMNASLVSIVSKVRAGTATIATAAGEIAAGNHDLSSRTEQQAASLEETASTMDALKL